MYTHNSLNSISVCPEVIDVDMLDDTNRLAITDNSVNQEAASDYEAASSDSSVGPGLEPKRKRPKRRRRCGQCANCLIPDCNNCPYCL